MLRGFLDYLRTSVAAKVGEHVTSWPKTFRAPATESRAEVVAVYRAAINRANRAIGAHPELSGALPHPRAGRSSPTLRWALTHMIEETARHAGHADTLREQIDGATGH